MGCALVSKIAPFKIDIEIPSEGVDEDSVVLNDDLVGINIPSRIVESTADALTGNLNDASHEENNNDNNDQASGSELVDEVNIKLDIPLDLAKRSAEDNHDVTDINIPIQVDDMLLPRYQYNELYGIESENMRKKRNIVKRAAEDNHDVSDINIPIQVDDMMLPRSQYNELYGIKSETLRKKRNAARGFQYRWPNNVVNYVITNVFSNSEKTVIEKAIKEWTDLTCFTFKQVDSNYKGNYLSFIKDGGCWSYVGMIGGKQSLSLERGCFAHSCARNRTCYWILS